MATQQLIEHPKIPWKWLSHNQAAIASVPMSLPVKLPGLELPSPFYSHEFIFKYQTNDINLEQNGEFQKHNIMALSCQRQTMQYSTKYLHNLLAYLIWS